jgi:hypothetical protein
MKFEYSEVTIERTNNTDSTAEKPSTNPIANKKKNSSLIPYTPAPSMNDPAPIKKVANSDSDELHYYRLNFAEGSDGVLVNVYVVDARNERHLRNKVNKINKNLDNAEDCRYTACLYLTDKDTKSNSENSPELRELLNSERVLKVYISDGLHTDTTNYKVSGNCTKRIITLSQKYFDNAHINGTLSHLFKYALKIMLEGRD